VNDGASGAHSLQPMKIIDRYIGTQFAGPFLVGVAAFVAILLGVGPVFDAARLVVRDGFPLTLVLQVFLLQIPSVIALTLPMGTVFAALMGSGELSSHGEIVAMRAGGVSIWRLATPVVLAGMCITILAFLFNEAIGPVSSAKASAMLREYVLTTRDINEPMVLRVPDRGEAKLLVYADRLSVREGRMSNVTIIEFKGKRAPVFRGIGALGRQTMGYAQCPAPVDDRERVRGSRERDRPCAHRQGPGGDPRRRQAKA